MEAISVGSGKSQSEMKLAELEEFERELREKYEASHMKGGTGSFSVVEGMCWTAVRKDIARRKNEQANEG